MSAPTTIRRRARPGDIVEIKTPAGLGYIQYTHDSGATGQLVRVLPGLYKDRPPDFGLLARQRELYFAFLILKKGFRTRIGRMEIVSNQPIPKWAESPPLMRHPASTDAQGKVTRWRIVSAGSKLTLDQLQKAPLLTSLTTEQRKLSIYEIWPPAVMVRNLAEGWTPEHSD